MKFKNGEFIQQAFSGMGGYWCSFCEGPHTSHSCSHPGRIFNRAMRIQRDNAIKRISKLENALEFYADENNYTEERIRGSRFTAIESDLGDTAREALVNKQD